MVKQFEVIREKYHGNNEKLRIIDKLVANILNKNGFESPQKLENQIGEETPRFH